MYVMFLIFKLNVLEVCGQSIGRSDIDFFFLAMGHGQVYLLVYLKSSTSNINASEDFPKWQSMEDI